MAKFNMPSLDLDGLEVTGAPTPTSDSSVANKAYVDSKVGGTPIDVSGYQKIENLTVNTARGTAAKTSVESVEFEDGVIYNVLFTQGSGVNNPTLNGVPIMLGATPANGTTFTIANSPTVVPMRYDGGQNRLNIQGSFRTSDAIESYALRWNSGGVVAGEEITQRKLIGMAADGKYYPFAIGPYTEIFTKIISETDFLIGTPILYNDSTTSFAKNAIVTPTVITSEASMGANSRFNMNVQSDWVPSMPVYLKATLTSPGTFRLAGAGTTGGDYMTQDLPTTDDGFIYILLGYISTASTNLRLIHQHPIYQFKDGGLRAYSPTTPVVDNLESTSTTSALSANQGRVLAEKIESILEMLVLKIVMEYEFRQDAGGGMWGMYYHSFFKEDEAVELNFYPPKGELELEVGVEYKVMVRDTEEDLVKILIDGVDIRDAANLNVVSYDKKTTPDSFGPVVYDLTVIFAVTTPGPFKLTDF